MQTDPIGQCDRAAATAFRTRRAPAAALGAAFSLALAIASGPVRADEGMWTFDNFPSAEVKQKYGVTIDGPWLDRVRGGIVRLENGCTGSLVSADGLVLTNHHCAASCIAERSSPQRDLFAKGFVAAGREAEERCETGRISVLVGSENVTDTIASATRGLEGEAAVAARRAAQTRLEQDCRAASEKDPRTGPLFCETVTLYQGGQSWLYKYRRYDDVRLVFAPEEDVGAFGGDPDNFQFPRWTFDMSLLRVYENGRPAKTPNHLRVDFDGPDAGEPTFVAGHPGTTNRLLTVPELQTQRDVLVPFWLLRAAELRGRLIQFGVGDPERARQASEFLQSLENSIKVRRKQLDALLDERVFAQKREHEQTLRRHLAAHPDLAREIGDPWADAARAQAAWRSMLVRYTFVEQGAAFNSVLANHATDLVRSAAERGKPNEQRLREYTETRLPALKQRLGASVPVYPEFERVKLAHGLERMREYLGPDDPLVRALLGRDSPEQVATRLVQGTKLADPKVRLALYDGGQAAIDASDDPLIRAVKLIDPAGRALRKRYEDEVEGPTRRAQERISKLRFAALGTTAYPDATFTLRLSYGAVGGWTENGVEVEPFTTVGRAFERATGAHPFRMPDSWLRAKDSLDPATPYNVSTTHDIVGGNSGSPLLNAKGDVVGLMFDGNIHSISGAYWYDAALNRAIAVDMRIAREALTKIYRAEALARELGIKAPKAAKKR